MKGQSKVLNRVNIKPVRDYRSPIAGHRFLWLRSVKFEHKGRICPICNRGFVIVIEPIGHRYFVIYTRAYIKIPKEIKKMPKHICPFCINRIDKDVLRIYSGAKK